MTQEDKELLLRDLCARLPYGIICDDGYGNVLELNGIDNPNTAIFKCSDKTFGTTDLDKCKPYLFPLSSMTEKQYNEFFTYYHNIEMAEVEASGDYLKAAYIGDDAKYSWLNKNHFDYRGLIEKGLAIDATNLNIY